MDGGHVVGGAVGGGSRAGGRGQEEAGGGHGEGGGVGGVEGVVLAAHPHGALQLERATPLIVEAYKLGRTYGECRRTGLQFGVFQGLSQVVQGSMEVKDAKKNRSAQAMITL